MVALRNIEPRDEARWRVLWEGYCRFYERDMSGMAPVTAHLWQRMMARVPSVHCRVAEDESGVIGMAHYILHDNTSTLTPVCYLQDLFVDPQCRAAGVGQQLIDWLVAEMQVQGWSRLYWNTKENNYRARGLYDKFTPHSGFLRYVVNNPSSG